jgi:hypothetical protein
MKYHYFIDRAGVVYGIPFDICDNNLEQARKQVPNEVEYIGTNKDDKHLIEWIKTFFPEEIV